jgi:DNA-binding CsgD family transcriptional regulator
LLEALDPALTRARAIVLEGEPGVGKTALWRYAVEAAGERGFNVITSAPAASEARLAFAALGDLLDPGLDDALETLPAPQREALEIALLRREGDLGEGDSAQRVIGVATLSALRGVATTTPLLVAIDDLQWMDAASAAVIRFALRRLRAERIVVVATRRLQLRGSAPLELERMLGDERVTRVRVGPLTLGGLHELLRSRIGLAVSRPTLIRLHETTGGNPLYALEIGHELVELGVEPAPDEPLPVPGSIRELINERLERLEPNTRDVLLAAAALGRPTRSLLTRFVDPVEEALDQGVAAGVIELSGERVRFTHPLIASVHYEHAPLAQRRRLHSKLSEIADTLEERARHLALASSGPDEEVARQLDRAGGDAAHRGAHDAAAELCDLAARLTPGQADRGKRVLSAAEYHRRAGNLTVAAYRATEVLELAREPAARTRALAVLGTVAGDTEGTDAAAALYRRALREQGAPRELRADLHQKLGWISLLTADGRRAEQHARAMLRLSAGGQPAVEAEAAATLSLAIAARGQPVRYDLLRRAIATETAGSSERPWAWAETSPAVFEGLVLLWGGELEQARQPLERIYRVAIDSGDAWLEMHALAYLSSLETSLGRPAAGLELARRYLELASGTDQDAQRAGALWPLAVAAGWLGRAQEARDSAREGLDLAQRTGHRLYVIGNLTALGAVELAAGEPEPAASYSIQAWELAHAGGLESPARFPVLPEAVEALLAIGDRDRAAELAREQRRIAVALGRPWVLALALRCEACVAAADGDEDRAISCFERAEQEHAKQERPLDRARTLVAYGSVLRRQRRKRAAREALEHALCTFQAADAGLWAHRARGELGRIGGRRAAPSGALSATESEVARLVASGRTNNEVAETLHLSARTVEWNLSKLYRKLGVRSRTELAMAMDSVGAGRAEVGPVGAGSAEPAPVGAGGTEPARVAANGASKSGDSSG